MLIALEEITQSAKDIRFTERIEDLNEIYREGQFRDFHFPGTLEVNLVYYRSGQEIFFQGSLDGVFEGCCSRCLQTYSFPLSQNFEIALAPLPDDSEIRAKELNRDELGLSYYAAEEINLSPLIREQVLLALPTRPLCGDQCRGLCAGCGVNLNVESCICPSPSDDPRMAIFRTLKLGQ